MIRYTLKIDTTGARELYSNIVFTAGDTRGYRLDFSFFNGKEKILTDGCGLVVKAKRADGAVVIDSGVINKEGCYWVAADNAYSVCGVLEIEVVLTKTDGTLATACVIFATVREGFGETGLASSDNEPILAKLSAQCLSVQASVNAHKDDEGAHAELFAKERESSNLLYATALSDHKTDEEAHAELFAKERASSNLLYATALSDHKTDEEAHAELFAKEREASNLLYATVLSDHKTDEGAHAELFAKERASSNLLYATALIDEAEHNTELLVSDVVPSTPIALSIYGACTETLPEGVTEKSLENPATITGVGESGSVTVTLTDGEGDETEIEIPLETPLYGICHPQTGEWLARDEIKVESGKVTLIRNINIFQITGQEKYINAFRRSTDGYVEFRIRNDDIPAIKASERNKILSVLSPQIVTGYSDAITPDKLILGYSGAYTQYVRFLLPLDVLGSTGGMTNDELASAFRAWAYTYNKTSEVPFLIYCVGSKKTSDITDTDAGKRLLSLWANGNMTVKTNENSPVGMRYHRELNSAYKELKNAIVAMGGVI